MFFHSALAILSVQCLCSTYAQELPSRDPFYQSQSKVSGLRPGEVIHSRCMPKLQDLPVPIPMNEGFQYLYRTTDSLGHAVSAVTTLMVPANASSPPKLLSYQIAYDSANIDCSPSYTLRAQANESGTDRAFIAASLAQGWYVVTPDYEGLSAQYGAGLQAGHATLDSIRAVLGDGARNGLQTTSETVVWGYSGGALASEWAAELQGGYAPELGANLRGFALGGLVPNLTRLVRTIDGTTNAGLTFLGIKGLSSAYPDLDKYVHQHLTSSKKQSFEDISNKCTIPALVEAANLSIYSYFDTGEGILLDPVPASVFRDGGQMGLHGVPQLPVFAYKAERDQFSPIGDTDALVDKLCGKGATIEYRRDSVGNHNTQAITGGATAFEWIRKIFGSDRADDAEACSVMNVTLRGDSMAKANDLGPLVIEYLRDELKGEGVS